MDECVGELVDGWMMVNGKWMDGRKDEWTMVERC